MSSLHALLLHLLLLITLLPLSSVGAAPPALTSPPPLTLHDPPIIARAHTSLDGLWSLHSRALLLPAGGRVPGDLISDLVAASLLPEPLFENNFLLNASLWNDDVWTYSRNVSLSARQVAALRSDVAGSDVWLVLDGVKMGASIELNGVQLAVSRHQFLRQELSLHALIRSVGLKVRVGDNALQVVFDPDIAEYGQFMACSGGWDWAPVSQSYTRQSKLAAYTRGLWKSVYLLDVDWMAIRHTTVHVHYTGPFPTSPLQPGAHSPFLLNVTLHLSAPQAADVDVSVTGDWRNATTHSTHCAVPAGNSTCSLGFLVDATQIELWWPNGRGAQPLYNVTVAVQSSGVGQAPLHVSRRVGFRVFHVVTGNDTNAEWRAAHASDNGSAPEQMGLRYRVNGEAVFSRGANFIPIDLLEGRYNPATLRRAVLSARDAGMNILRVWAGGIWQSEAFFDTADEVGLMVYHDQINRGSYSSRLEDTAAYQHQLRRIGSHPSLVAFSMCNECFPWAGGGIVPQLVSLVVSEDDSRPVWPACPAQGWRSGVNRLTGLPNGEKFAMYDASTWGPTDTHGPYQHGDGFPAVNGNPTDLSLFEPMTPPTFDSSSRIGLQYNHTFTSEFGAVTWSSFESLSATFAPQHWSLHGGSPPDNCTYGFLGGNQCNGSNVVAQRNYPCDSIVVVYFGGGREQLDAVGKEALQRQLFHCLIGSALILKGYVEQHRASNTFGLMVWQLNEIWPTGGWGSLEYGNGAFPGQVEGGRWKPSHYWLMNSLFTDVMLSCGRASSSSSSSWMSGELLCYVKLDAWQPSISEYTVVVEQYQLADGSRRRLELPVELPPGPGSIHWFSLNSSWYSNSCVLQLSVVDADAARQLRTSNFFLSASPSRLALIAGSLDVTVSVGEPSPGGAVPIAIRKGSAAVALFFTLTTLAAGRFSHNAFHLYTRAGEQHNVTFIPFGPLNHSLLTSSLRFEHANMYRGKEPHTLQHMPRQQLPSLHAG